VAAIKSKVFDEDKGGHTKVTVHEVHVTLEMAECLYRCGTARFAGFTYEDTLNKRALKACFDLGYIEHGAWRNDRATVQLTELGYMAMRLTRPKRSW
jgi:hypothetical protein